MPAADAGTRHPDVNSELLPVENGVSVACWCQNVSEDLIGMLFLSVDWSKAERIRQKRTSHVIGAYS